MKLLKLIAYIYIYIYIYIFKKKGVLVRFQARGRVEFNGCVGCEDQDLSEKAKAPNDRILSPTE